MPARKKVAKKAVKRTRTPKSDAIKGEVEPEVITVPSPVNPAISMMNESTVNVTADLDAVNLFEGAPELPVKDELRPDQDLKEAEKAEFKRLLDKEMSIAKRAKQLVKLASFSDTKRAPVALRAIQVINEITGVTDDLANEAPSMFSLPEGVHVKIDVETPEK